jgi:hypothetical protein
VRINFLKVSKDMSTYFRGLAFSFVAIAITVVSSASASAVNVGYQGSVGVQGGTGGYGQSSPSGMDNMFNLPAGSVYGILATIVNWLLAIFGILGILGFVISGIMYLVSFGDEKMATKAKSGMLFSIIGIIVGLSGFIIMQVVNGLLNGNGGTF